LPGLASNLILLVSTSNGTGIIDVCHCPWKLVIFIKIMIIFILNIYSLKYDYGNKCVCDGRNTTRRVAFVVSKGKFLNYGKESRDQRN
jgi:hypothetical protein